MKIIEIKSQTQIAQLAAEENSIVVMNPEWSSYPKEVTTKLRALSQELKDSLISVFAVSKDNHEDNPEFIKWVTQNDGAVKLTPFVFSGAGSLVLSKYGKPVHVVSSTYQLSMDEIKDIIYSHLQ